jgi:hypothetical protein
MAAAIVKLAQPDCYQRASRAARQRAVDRFDIEPWLARHRQVFESLVG